MQISDAAFTQSTLGILVTLGLGLLLQAKLVGGPNAHPISTGWRRSLAIFEVFLTTTLSVVGVALGAFLFEHLATATRALSLVERRGVGSLLLLLVSGLAFMAVANRAVSVAWKAPGHDSTEPTWDTDVVYGVGSAFVVGVLIAGAVYTVSGRFGAAWLLILIFGLLAVAMPPASSAAGRLLERRFESQRRALWERRGFEGTVLVARLPDGVDPVAVEVFRSRNGPQGDFLPIDEARLIVRRLNRAADRAVADDRYAKVRPGLRLLLTRDSRFSIVAVPHLPAGERRPRRRWSLQPRTGAPRGLVAWIPGDGIPELWESPSPATD